MKIFELRNPRSAFLSGLEFYCNRQMVLLTSRHCRRMQKKWKKYRTVGSSAIYPKVQYLYIIQVGLRQHINLVASRNVRFTNVTICSISLSTDKVLSFSLSDSLPFPIQVPFFFLRNTLQSHMFRNRIIYMSRSLNRPICRPVAVVKWMVNKPWLSAINLHESDSMAR